MKGLLFLVQKLFGKNALGKAMGTRTNVIKLPNNEKKRLIKNELDIERASDAAAENLKKEAEELIAELPKMNDQERLIFEGNLRRLDNKLNPPSAEVIDIKTSKPVAGIEQLAAERGFPKGVDPESTMGRLLTSTRKLQDEAEKLKKQTPSQQFEDLLKNPYRSGGPLDPTSGIVRTAARQILRKKLDAGEIDIPDAAERDAIAKGYQGGVDPIEVFRKRFGEDPLQDLDEIADELNRAGDFKKIDEILKRNKLFDIEPKKDYGYQEGSYTDEEMMELLKKSEEDPDKFAKGGKVEKGSSKIFDQLEMDIPHPYGHRVEYAYGSGLKLLKLLKKKGKDLKKEIKKAVDDLNPTGDPKLDADMAVDNMLEDLNIDRDTLDQYDILDAYGLAYNELKQPLLKQIKNKPGSKPIKKGDPITSENFGESQFAPDTSELEKARELAPKMTERFELQQKYPGLDGKLLTQIIDDPDPQRKAEVLATIDQAFELMRQGKSQEEVYDIMKQMTDRTKQAGGGLAYLMGL